MKKFLIIFFIFLSEISFSQVDIGTPSQDISDYPKKSANETITGKFTFSDTILITQKGIKNNTAGLNVLFTATGSSDFLTMGNTSLRNYIQIGNINNTDGIDLYTGNTNPISIRSTTTSLYNNLSLATVGKNFYVKEGTNAIMGVATLSSGTITVNTTKVTASSRIFVFGQNTSGTIGELTISSRVAGTSFTITGVGTDTRDVAWIIIEPAP